MQRHVCVVKDRADCDAKRGLAVVAAMTVLTSCGIERSAVWAAWLVTPAGRLKMGDAILLCGELLENLYNINGIPLPFEPYQSLDKINMVPTERNVKTLN